MSDTLGSIPYASIGGTLLWENAAGTTAFKISNKNTATFASLDNISIFLLNYPQEEYA